MADKTDGGSSSRTIQKKLASATNREEDDWEFSRKEYFAVSLRLNDPSTQTITDRSQRYHHDFLSGLVTVTYENLNKEARGVLLQVVPEDPRKKYTITQQIIFFKAENFQSLNTKDQDIIGQTVPLVKTYNKEDWFVTKCLVYPGGGGSSRILRCLDMGEGVAGFEVRSGANPISFSLKWESLVLLIVDRQKTGDTEYSFSIFALNLHTSCYARPVSNADEHGLKKIIFTPGVQSSSHIANLDSICSYKLASSFPSVGGTSVKDDGQQDGTYICYEECGEQWYLGYDESQTSSGNTQIMAGICGKSGIMPKKFYFRESGLCP